MTKYAICRAIGGVLVVLIGVVVGVGSYQLRNGAPPSWPDIVAKDPAVRTVSKGMAAVAGLLVIGGLIAAIGLGWGYWAATGATIVFVAGGFWANYILFGSLRPFHTGTNIVVCAMIQWLLWIGYMEHLQ